MRIILILMVLLLLTVTAFAGGRAPAGGVPGAGGGGVAVRPTYHPQRNVSPPPITDPDKTREEIRDLKREIQNAFWENEVNYWFEEFKSCSNDSKTVDLSSECVEVVCHRMEARMGKSVKSCDELKKGD